MSTYTPHPIDTSFLQLSGDLTDLTERIAENVHDVWAAGRIAQGWTYGKIRNDALKQTPCLVPYNELPESEKEYDRNTALETLRLILVLGYRIEKCGVSEEDDVLFCEDITGILGQIFAARSIDIPDEAMLHLADAYAICAECYE